MLARAIDRRLDCSGAGPADGFNDQGIDDDRGVAVVAEALAVESGESVAHRCRIGDRNLDRAVRTLGSHPCSRIDRDAAGGDALLDQRLARQPFQGRQRC